MRNAQLFAHLKVLWPRNVQLNHQANGEKQERSNFWEFHCSTLACSLSRLNKGRHLLCFFLLRPIRMARALRLYSIFLGADLIHPRLDHQLHRPPGD